MSYYFSKKLDLGFEEAMEKVTDVLKSEGFSILTEIDLKETLKKKLDVDFRPYKILGACNAPFAHKALEVEDKIEAMHPCNVIVQQLEDRVEVAAIDPVSSMMAVKNDRLGKVASTIQSKLKSVIEGL